MDNKYKWYCAVAITAIIMLGFYFTIDNVLNRMEKMQEVSRQVIEK